MAFAGGGLNAGLHDLGRVGLLMLNEGSVYGRRFSGAMAAKSCAVDVLAIQSIASRHCVADESDCRLGDRDSFFYDPQSFSDSSAALDNELVLDPVKQDQKVQGVIMPKELSLIVNGERRSTRTDEDRPLLDVLREDFKLTGTKYGCGEGECGACTVLLDGVPVRSCITSVGEVGNTEVQTIEGLADDGKLHPVQQAFLDHEAMQCGYCVPGHIMTAVALARENPNASRAEIVATMSEHICRCCNYSSILAAVEQAVSLDQGQIGSER